MAQFDASINLSVNSSKAEQQVKKIERAVNKVNDAASKLDFNNKNLDRAAEAAERLFKSLEKIESAALSKLPTSVQTLIAYLKAANVATAKLTANAVGAASGFKQLSGVSLAPIIKAQTQVITNFKQTGSAIQKIDSDIVKATSSFDILLARIIAVRVQLEGIKRITGGGAGGAGFIGGSGGGGGNGGGGGGGEFLPGQNPRQKALPPNNQNLIDNANTLRGLQNLRRELVELLETATIGTRAFRLYEDQIEQVNNRIRDAQLVGQRGGSGVDQRRQQRQNRFFNSRSAAARGGFSGGGGLAAGIGFPLLFGSGAGSILGGAGGSAFGFGGQILGSALGGQLDQLTQKAGDFAKALRGVGSIFDALEATISGVDNQTKRYIQNLENSGQKVEAAALAADVLAQKIGVENAEAFIRAGQAADGATDSLKNVGTVLTALAERFRAAGENPTGQTPNGVLDLLPPQFRPTPPTPVENTPEFQNRTTDLQAQLAIERLLTQENEKQAAINTTNLAIEKIRRDEKARNLSAEQASIKIDIEKERLARKLADIEEQRTNEIEQRIKAQERARQAEQRELERQQRERERQQREAEAALKRARQGRAAVLSEVQRQNELNLRLTELEEGRVAAIRDELQQLKYKVQEQVRINELTIEDVNLRQEKLITLQREAELRQNILNLELASLRVQERLTKLQGERAVEDISRDLNRQIQDANRRPTGDVFGDEQADLRIDQLRRELDIRSDLNREIADQQVRIEELSLAVNDQGQVLDPEALQAAKDQRKNLEDQLAVYDRLLPKLNAAEQAQLRYNQVLEAATPFAEAFATSLTQGLRDVVAGTQTAEEAFADFLNNIANLLVQTAATMIAQYIAIGIAKAFAGLGGGGVGGSVNTGNVGGITSLKEVIPVRGFFNPDVFRAAGGSVSAGSPYIVGESGSELFIPNVSGRVIPNDDYEAARAVLNQNVNGEGAVSEQEAMADSRNYVTNNSYSSSQAFSESQAALATSTSSTERVFERQMLERQFSNPAPIRLDVETTVINGIEYLTVEQGEAMTAAAVQQAKGQVFSDLKNRPAARRQVGMR